MRQLSLKAIPNQTLGFVLDGTRYDLTLKSGGGVMLLDAKVDNGYVVRGARVAPGALLIPYRHLAPGNFIFVTANEELPTWREFGLTQKLFYLAPNEL